MSDLNDWNAQVIAEFRANGGKVAQFGDNQVVILHTIGARSGKEYENPLVTIRDGDRQVVIASKGGAPTHPDWYHNLVANPEIEVELGTETVRMRATEVAGEERDRLYAAAAEAMPFFAEYATSAAPRVIPVLVLERI